MCSPTRITILLVLAAVSISRSASADILEIRNVAVDGSGIGSFASTLDMSDEFPHSTPGYDAGLDHLIDTSINPLDQFFVIYIPLDDGTETVYDVKRNFTPYAEAWDTYQFRLSFENRLENEVVVENAVHFDAFDLSENPIGVTDFVYYLEVDTNPDGRYDHFESGRVSKIMASPDRRTESWLQTIPSGFDHRDGAYYGTLTVRGIGLEADFDEDGDVDGDDFLYWQGGGSHYPGDTAIHADGDADFDGDVDGDDFLIWQSQFGSVSGSASATVPEPTAFLLAITIIAVGRWAVPA